jgi:hypothetical protein
MVVWVRNTFNPHARGTRIAPRSLRDSRAALADSAPVFSTSSHEGGAA